MKRNNKKGFTIVELVIVIAVIGILAAVLIPTFSGVIDDANENAAKQYARNTYTQLYADDLADGKIDGNSAANTPLVYDTNTISYSYDANGKVTVKVLKNGYVGTFDGTNLTAVEGNSLS